MAGAGCGAESSMLVRTLNGLWRLHIIRVEHMLAISRLRDDTANRVVRSMGSMCRHQSRIAEVNASLTRTASDEEAPPFHHVNTKSMPTDSSIFRSPDCSPEIWGTIRRIKVLRLTNHLSHCCMHPAQCDRTDEIFASRIYKYPKLHSRYRASSRVTAFVY